MNVPTTSTIVEKLHKSILAVSVNLEVICQLENGVGARMGIASSLNKLLPGVCCDFKARQSHTHRCC